jgi:hypothetical protein
MRQEREVHRLANSAGRLERSRLNRWFPSCSSEVIPVKGESLRSDASSFLAALPKATRRCCCQLASGSFSTTTGVLESGRARSLLCLTLPLRRPCRGCGRGWRPEFIPSACIVGLRVGISCLIYRGGNARSLPPCPTCSNLTRDLTRRRGDWSATKRVKGPVEKAVDTNCQAKFRGRLWHKCHANGYIW